MIRGALAVVAGYLVMVVLVFATFTGLYFALGTERTFEPGRYAVAPAWLVGSYLLSALAAVTGGATCRLIARGPTPPKVLAALVLGLGIASAAFVLTAPKPEPKVREGAATNLEAMMGAEEPPFVALTTPLIGAAGCLTGAWMVGRSRAKVRAEPALA